MVRLVVPVVPLNSFRQFKQRIAQQIVPKHVCTLEKSTCSPHPSLGLWQINYLNFFIVQHAARPSRWIGASIVAISQRGIVDDLLLLTFGGLTCQRPKIVQIQDLLGYLSF